MVQQMNQKAPDRDPGPKGRPGTRVPGPKGPRGPALFGSSAGPFWRCPQGIDYFVVYVFFINFAMCLCNIFMASGGGPEYIWGGILDGLGDVFGRYLDGLWKVLDQLQVHQVRNQAT